MYCQMFSTGFSSGERDGLRTLGDMAGYLVEMKLHGFGVGLRQGERGGCSARWTDGTEEVCIFIALVDGLSGSRSAPGPLSDDTIFLTDAGFVLEPDFDRCFLWDIGQMHAQRAREVF